MAFKLVTDPTYRHPVTVQIPQGDGVAEHGLTAEFNYITQTRLEALAAVGDGDLLDEVLAGWSGFKDADGEEIPYNPENRAQLLDTPYLRVGLVSGFWDSVHGRQDRRKN